MGFLILRSSSSEAITGLDWDGTAPGRRMLYWHTPFAIYPATFLFKVYPRNQVSTRTDTSRYFTTFFWGNDGDFHWDTGGPGPMFDTNSYYGCHPYPTPNPDGDGKWEISVYGEDKVTRDDASAPFVTFDQWYSQAFVASRTNSTDTNHKFYIDLPSVATSNTITRNITGDGNWADTDPPTPAIVVGQAPDNGTGKSWGGYDGWEEANEIIRGLQFYDSALTEQQILDRAACETNAEVLALGAPTPWYLNMNPSPDDVTDKSGSGHDGSWAGAERPTLWTQ